MNFEAYQIENLLELSGNDTAFVLEVLNMFVQTLKSEETEIKTALEEQNWPTAQFISHRLRSSAGSIGAKNIYVSCKELENYIKANKIIEEEIILLAQNLFASCIFDLSEIKKELTKLGQNSLD
jgi:HPt (histidine-containing phosphotransfer) domain-containing protein